MKNLDTIAKERKLLMQGGQQIKLSRAVLFSIIHPFPYRILGNMGGSRQYRLFKQTLPV